MNIPKVRSAPFDPKAPSLLTLPAEIRNSINEYIFIRPESILIHDANFYYNSGSYGCEDNSHLLFPKHTFGSDEEEQVYRSKNTRCSKSLKGWETRSDAEKEDALLFRHEASLGIGLLKSCRQMYHETSSILYSKNTFVVSQVRERAPHEEWKACESENRRDYHQVSYTPKWLASLGFQLRQLREMVIDVSAYTYVYSDATPDWLPLLRTIWDGLLMRCDISFAHTGRRTEFHPVRNSRGLVPIATRLNRALNALAKDNTLRLRRYTISRSLMSSVTISAGGDSGCVQFYIGTRSISRGFWIDEASENAVWFTPETITSPMDLPLQVKDIVCRHVFAHDPRLRIVVNSLNPLGCRRAVFDVSWGFRMSFIRSVATDIPIIVELEAAPADMDYNALDPFRRYSLIARAPLKRDLYHKRMAHLPDLLSPHNSLISQIIRENAKDRYREEQDNDKTTLLIRVPLVRPAKPTDICINISVLLSWLEGVGHKNCRDEVALVIQLEYANGRELSYETNSTTIGQLKMQIFLSFTGMLNRHSRGEESGPELPELWIDGHANLVDLASPSMEFRSSQTYSMESEVSKRHIKSVLDDIEARHSLKDQLDCVMYGSYPCMCHAWRSLRPWAESVWRKEQL
ncbi:hypothetical protein AG0111_0g12271 [Alternaria gaisen]|uniref:Uncharacterized protein n=1 Tax=Alternaria gaisen TaxID=167740 RepID=A0ACB6F4L1_9PLEO|nr:hypothetical protein AG0111_0g12271 [Alternaria gaisen]